MASSLAILALVAFLGTVQCQSNFDRDFDRENEPPSEGCYNKVMDLFFVLDSSSSIYVNDFRREHEFVKDVVARLDIGQRKTRVGMLTFSDDFTRPVVGLNRYLSKNEVLSGINDQNLPYRTGVTNTDLAIQYVRESTEFRQDITKVMVVVTDGGSRSPGSTAREAELARESGFYMFVVGIGQYLDEREWRQIASDPDDSFIYNITNFRFLDDVKFSLPPRACALPPIIVGRVCRAEVPADLYFLAAPGGAQDAIQLLDNFEVVGQPRVSYVIPGVCDRAQNVGTDNFRVECDRNQLLPDSNANTFPDMLVTLREMVNDNRLTRDDKQVAVLFMDADTVRLSRRYDLRREVRSLVDDGVEVLVVDLGYSGNFLEEVTGSRTISLDEFTRNPSTGQRYDRATTQRLFRREVINRTCAVLNDRISDPNVVPT